MYWTIQKLYSPPILRATASGMWDLKEFALMVAELSAEILKYPFCSILIDDRQLKWERVEISDMEAVRDLFTSSDHAFAHTRIAFLMESINDFFAAYQFQTITQPASSAILKVFYEEAAAIQWLTIKQA